jgi:hypothetical protein
MKTTVEISDALLRAVRELGMREGVTLRTLVERGLHRVVAETKNGAPSSFAAPASRAKGCSPNSAKHRGADCAI